MQLQLGWHCEMRVLPSTWFSSFLLVNWHLDRTSTTTEVPPRSKLSPFPLHQAIAFPFLVILAMR